MREIKFRVWNKTINEMTHDVESIDFGRNGKINQVNTQQDRILFPDKECVLMQYTGLKDKNGKEIYEGDFVVCRRMRDGNVFGNAWKTVDGVSVPNPQEIKWREDNRGWDCFDNLWYEPEEWEVIGNIYENPDLLGKGE